MPHVAARAGGGGDAAAAAGGDARYGDARRRHRTHPSQGGERPGSRAITDPLLVLAAPLAVALLLLAPLPQRLGGRAGGAGREQIDELAVGATGDRLQLLLLVAGVAVLRLILRVR